MSKDTLDEVEFVGPGAILKAAREEQGLTRELVADKLHLRLTIIQSLEEDQYSNDISPTFTKGYLKLYSRLLGLDDTDVLIAYQQLGTLEKEPAKLQSFSQKVARQASDQRLMLFTYFLLIIVVGLVVVWWLQQDDSSLSSFVERTTKSQSSQNESNQSKATQRKPDENKASGNQLENSSQPNAITESLPAEGQTPKEVVEPGINNTVPQEQASELTEDAVPQEVSENNSSDAPSLSNNEQASTENLSIPSEASATASQALVTNAQSRLDDSSLSDTSVGEAEENNASEAIDSTSILTDPVELVFEFSGDCWMKLTDATGEDVAYGVKASGRIMPVSGIPPFEVVLGAPESVQISYAGEAINMAQFRPGYTARFNLPLSE